MTTIPDSIKTCHCSATYQSAINLLHKISIYILILISLGIFFHLHFFVSSAWTCISGDSKKEENLRSTMPNTTFPFRLHSPVRPMEITCENWLLQLSYLTFPWLREIFASIISSCMQIKVSPNRKKCKRSIQTCDLDYVKKIDIL